MAAPMGGEPEVRGPRNGTMDLQGFKTPLDPVPPWGGGTFPIQETFHGPTDRWPGGKVLAGTTASPGCATVKGREESDGPKQPLPEP